MVESGCVRTVMTPNKYNNIYYFIKRALNSNPVGNITYGLVTFILMRGDSIFDRNDPQTQVQIQFGCE